jgi:hypothetical protein
MSENDGIRYGGLHHLALVCRDKERTADFHADVVQIPADAAGIKASGQPIAGA